MPRLQKPDPLAKAIGRRVHELIRERGLKPDRFGSRAGISPATLSDLRKGLARPSVVTLRAIADGLDVELLDLFTHPSDSDRHRLIDRSRRLSAKTLRRILAETDEESDST